MKFEDWKTQQLTVRMHPLNQLMKEFPELQTPRALANFPFENFDQSLVRSFPNDPRIKMIVEGAKALTNDLRMRRGERAPRLRQGRGRLVKHDRWKAAAFLSLSL